MTGMDFSHVTGRACSLSRAAGIRILRPLGERVSLGANQQDRNSSLGIKDFMKFDEMASYAKLIESNDGEPRRKKSHRTG